MKKIVCMLKPFSIQQQIYVYEDGNKIEAVECTIEDFTETIFTLNNNYEGLDEVDLVGPKQYAKGLQFMLEYEEKQKYGNGVIKYNII